MIKVATFSNQITQNRKTTIDQEERGLFLTLSVRNWVWFAYLSVSNTVTAIRFFHENWIEVRPPCSCLEQNILYLYVCKLYFIPLPLKGSVHLFLNGNFSTFKIN